MDEYDASSPTIGVGFRRTDVDDTPCVGHCVKHLGRLVEPNDNRRLHAFVMHPQGEHSMQPGPFPACCLTVLGEEPSHEGRTVHYRTPEELGFEHITEASLQQALEEMKGQQMGLFRPIGNDCWVVADKVLQRANELGRNHEAR